MAGAGAGFWTTGNRRLATMSLIELRNVHKRFGRLVVLNGVSLNIEEGQSLVVIGASGTGKSVFFGAAIGLIACYKGFNSGAGASGVGRACTESFVASFLAIIVLNFFFAHMLRAMYTAIYGVRGVFE